jgi:predicted  nucleic acid-binding Zn-ribbon protein
MENDRLSLVIARIDAAAARIAEAQLAGSAPTDQDAERKLQQEVAALNSAHATAIDERDRAIAKLRADAADIDKLKDQEIERLRAELQSQAAETGALNTAAHEAELHALQQKYDRLYAAASTVLNDLDTIIEQAEQATNG